MAAMVFCMNVPDGDRGTVRAACMNQGIIMQVVQPEDFDLTIRELTGGLKGHAEEKLFEDTVYLMHNLSREQFDGFLDAIRPCRGLRAIDTPTNRRWKVAELVQELKAEDKQLRGTGA